jgi:ATP adenylyltransferase
MPSSTGLPPTWPVTCGSADAGIRGLVTSPLDHLWAGWRSEYIDSVVDGRSGDAATRGPHEPPDGPGSLFERILEMPDDEGYIVHRGEGCAVVLNAYPYTNGHVLVLPNRAVADLADLDLDIHDELWRMVRDAVSAIRLAYRCDGVNVGMNLGSAAGAGVPDHLHVHCLPRWSGDTNFMTSVANTRVMPEPLDVSWRRLGDAWPR